MLHLFIFHLLKFNIVSPRWVGGRVRSDLGQATSLLDDVVGVADSGELVEVDVVWQVGHAGAGGDEFDPVLPIPSDLFEGSGQSSLDLLAEFVPIEWTGQRNHAGRGVLILELVDDLGHEVV